MRSGILRARVATLRLNRWAPWPSELVGRAARYLVGNIRKPITQRRGFAGRDLRGICPNPAGPNLRIVK